MRGIASECQSGESAEVKREMNAAGGACARVCVLDAFSRAFARSMIECCATSRLLVESTGSMAFIKSRHR